MVDDLDDIDLPPDIRDIVDRLEPPRNNPNSGNSDAPEFSDEALALHFAAEHESNLRYVHEWGKWLRWDGRRWEMDKTLVALDAARMLCRKAAAQSANGKSSH